MKAVTLGIFLVIFLALFPFESSAQSAQGGGRPLFGTWANKEYTNSYHAWRFIYQSDGKIFLWKNGKPSDQPYNHENRFSIDKEWPDSEGNTWYRTAEKACIAPYSDAKANSWYGLVKVLKGGDTLEAEWSSVDFPPEFGALGGKHFTYYREYENRE